jgi:hypothetical protein
MKSSDYSVDEVAREILVSAAARKTYIVLPRFAVRLWRLKRWLPNLFLKRARTLRKELQGRESSDGVSLRTRRYR